MSISMLEHANGMLLPRCNRCGRDVFSRDLSSMKALHTNAGIGIEIMPHGLNCDLIGQGLRQNDFTCSNCLRESNLDALP